jgi:hypothetical protein
MNDKLIILKAITLAGLKKNRVDPYEYLEKLLIDEIAGLISSELDKMGYTILKNNTYENSKI